LADFIEQVKAFRLELAGGNLSLHTMVIIPWSD
jgi:hypothetical protein